MDRMLARRMKTPYVVINPGTKDHRGDSMSVTTVGEYGYYQFSQKLVKTVSGEERVSSSRIYTNGLTTQVTPESRIRITQLELPVLALEKYGQEGEEAVAVIYL